MARIIISLSSDDIGNLLLGGEISVSPSVNNFDNLSEIIIKKDQYDCTDSEVEEND